jgi:opacity protein-like surface antigen
LLQSAAPVAGSTAAILVALAGSAGAADGVMPTKATPIPYANAFDWSGFYVGGHVAYCLGQGTSTLSDPNPTIVGEAACRRRAGWVVIETSA